MPRGKLQVEHNAVLARLELLLHKPSAQRLTSQLLSEYLYDGQDLYVAVDAPSRGVGSRAKREEKVVNARHETAKGFIVPRVAG